MQKPPHSVAVEDCFCWLEFIHPKADAPPRGLEDFDLPLTSGLASPEKDLLSASGFVFSSVADLGVSAKREGAASNPTGCCADVEREVFVRDGRNTFIPRPRPARLYPVFDIEPEADASGRVP